MKTALLLAALALLALTGCEKQPPCLRSHLQPITSVVIVGKTVAPITTWIEVCDQRAPKDTP